MAASHRTMADLAPTAAAGATVLPMVLFLASTFGQRLGVWVAGFPLPLVLFAAPLVYGWAYWRGYVRLSIVRGLLFLLMASSFTVSFALARPDWVSVPSAALMILLYATWALYSPVTTEQYKGYVHRIGVIVAIFAVLTVVQYAGQYAVRSELWFSWRSILPADILIEYNTLNEMSYGAGVYKGNGMFLLEPSTVSGLIARVFLLTLIVLGDLRFALPYAAGLLAAFSGTGLIFTGLFTVPASLRQLSAMRLTLPRLFAIVVVVAGLVFVVAGTFVGDYFLARTGEFSDPKASGHARFTSNFILFDRYLTQDATHFLIGYGPGSFKYLVADIPDETFGSGWIKLFLEYGLFGILTFSSFFLYCVYSSTRSILLTVALLVQYMVLDGALVVPQLSFLAYAIFVAPVRTSVSEVEASTQEAEASHATVGDAAARPA